MNNEVKKRRLENRLGPEIEAFREAKLTLQLATVDENGVPNVSYAPFVFNEGCYFVLISEIAKHTRNLLVNPQASLQLIEDEGSAEKIFARNRLTYQASVHLIERETELWQDVIIQMQGRFGEIIDGLSQLADFKLIKLKPIQGVYVKGFGQAFQVMVDDSLDVVHLQKGHQKIKA